MVFSYDMATLYRESKLLFPIEEHDGCGARHEKRERPRAFTGTGAANLWGQAYFRRALGALKPEAS